MPQLFEPLTLRGVTIPNRIVMSPMCMYSCHNEDGMVNDWHLVHYTSRAVGQVGLIMIEATAVTPGGRISAQDLGIWSDEHVDGLRRLTDMVHAHGSKIGIQLAHAGRKATVPGIIAPSALRFSEAYETPEEMTLEDIRKTIKAFADAARRRRGRIRRDRDSRRARVFDQPVPVPAHEPADRQLRRRRRRPLPLLERSD